MIIPQRMQSLQAFYALEASRVIYEIFNCSAALSSYLMQQFVFYSGLATTESSMPTMVAVSETLRVISLYNY